MEKKAAGSGIGEGFEDEAIVRSLGISRRVSMVVALRTLLSLLFIGLVRKFATVFSLALIYLISKSYWSSQAAILRTCGVASLL